MNTIEEYIERHYEADDQLFDKEILSQAQVLVSDLFADATDKAGVPYIEHLKAVASQVRGSREKVVALLHDTLEDVSDKYSEEMMRCQFGDYITDTVKLLTHGDHLTREEYLDCIREIAASENLTAIYVKIADLTHNSEISRLGAESLEDLTLKQRARFDKYQEALSILRKAAGNIWTKKYNAYIDYMMGDPSEYMDDLGN